MHAWNPSYLWCRGGRIASVRPHLKGEKQNGWRSGSSGKAPALQARGPELKSRYCKEEKETDPRIAGLRESRA